MKDNPAAREMFEVMVTFLLPILLFSEMITMYEKNLLHKLKVNFFYGFLSSLLGIFFTFVGCIFADIIGITSEKTQSYSWQVKFSMTCLINLTCDSGYRIVRSRGSPELYKILREKFIINLIMTIGIIYVMRNENVSHQSSFTAGLLTYLGMLIISISLGLFLGIAFTLIQNRSTSLRKNPLQEMQFFLFFLFVCHFFVQVESDYLCDEIPTITLGLFLAAFSKFNMSPAGASRFLFLLELLARLAKIVTMAILGLTLPSAFKTFSVIGRVIEIYTFYLPMTFLAALVNFCLCKCFKPTQEQFGWKEFLIMYCTSIGKGPLAILLAKKYFFFSNQLSCEVDLFIISSILVFDPLTYLVVRLLPRNSKNISIEDKVRDKNNAIEMNDKKSKWARMLGYFSESILSPFFINNYRRRKEEGDFDLIKNIEDMVVTKADTTEHEQVKEILKSDFITNLLAAN